MVPDGSPQAAQAAMVPLVVDLDGTLTHSDLLVENILTFLARRPFEVWRLPLWIRSGKATLKARLAHEAPPDMETIPLNERVLDLVAAERSAGRKVYLASASDETLVESLASHVGLFDGVFASDGTTNLSGVRKADALVEAFGERGFDYVGNAGVDLEVWGRARRVIGVNCSPMLKAKMARRYATVDHLSTKSRRVDSYIKALRPHQWAKNALLFLPMLAGHALTPTNLITLGIAFVAFSSIASAAYVINDLLDLQADRLHPTKRGRPWASGALPLVHGGTLVPALLALGFGLAALSGAAFLLAILAYFAATLAYSLVLKKLPVVDVMALAGLYMARVLAGGIAIRLTLSEFLLGFCLFFFMCLALVKRHAELQRSLEAGFGNPRRGYRTSDLPFVFTSAVASGYSAVIVLALYVTSPDVAELYAVPEGIWAVCVVVLLWINRTLLLAHRGEMHDDPIVFALRDHPSYIMVALVGILVVASSS